MLRGDFGTITIGARTSVQDGTVIHAGPGFPTWSVTAASSGTWPTWRGAPWRTTAWSGSGSVVLHHAVVGSGATVGANAVVPNNMEVPPGALALGVPATIRPDRSDLDHDPVVGGGVRRQRPALPSGA